MAGAVQLILGFIRYLGVTAVAQMHFAVAVLAMVASIVAGAAALGFRQVSQGDSNVVWLALLMAITSVIQYGLGEASVVIAHMAMGVIFVIGTVTLAALVYCRPFFSAETTNE